MSKIYSFSEFINESYKKDYGQKMTHEEFKSLKKGDKLLYRGMRWTVETPGEHAHKLTNAQGNTKLINFKMFNDGAAITEAKKNKIDQDGDGDMDFADAKIAAYTKGGIAKDKAVAMSRKFNKTGKAKKAKPAKSKKA